MKKNWGWLFSKVLPKLPIFLLALPFAFLMRLLRPIIWIRLIPVSERIGHAVANTDVYLLERRAGFESSKAVDIFYPDRPWKCNRQLIKMWQRLIPLHDFVYWIAWVNLKIPWGSAPHHYVSIRNGRDINALSDDTPPPVSFTRKEEDQGAALLRAMGVPVGSRIICFHGRDSAFLKVLRPEADWNYHDYRDVDINTYVPAIKELVKRGYYCIRMGRVVNQEFSWKHPQVIDYATGPWRSDFADMYLISRCYFYIGTSCGIDFVASLFRKPQVILNIVPMSHVCAWSSNYFNIFKKLWLKEEKRFLTFKEIVSSDVAEYMDGWQYQQRGLEVVSNTPEEILDAVIEKEERMNGSWQTNDEHEKLQQEFWGLFQPNAFNRVFRARVGSKFLLQNRQLLLGKYNAIYSNGA